MLRDVAIIGIGSTVFGIHKGRTIKSLALEAAEEALVDARIPRKQIQSLLVGNFLSGVLTGQEVLAPLIAHELGLSGIETIKVEGACASSAIAVRLAYQQIAAGWLDTVLVLGVEKMTGASAEAATVAINAATDTETEGAAGLTFPGFWGLVMQRYMRQFGASREQIAAVTIKNRRHGVSNDKAQFRSAVSLEDILSSRAICDPVLLYDCCPITDGAAALVLTAADLAVSHPGPVRILGSGLASGPSRVADYEDLTTFPSTIRAARQAYSQAQITSEHIDVVELHDCFSMAEIVDSEDLGLIPRGEGAEAVARGETAVGGRIPINPSGGLLSKGHPVGATGCGQIYEIVRQLRGIHPNQVPGARVGLTHNAGGTSTVATVHILGMMA